MSKRLQVLLEDAELRDVQKAAWQARMTTAEWVRRALRPARRLQLATDTSRKLHVIDAPLESGWPVTGRETPPSGP